MALSNLSEAEQGLLLELVRKGDGCSPAEIALRDELLAKSSDDNKTASTGAIFKSPEEEAILSKILAHLRQNPKAKAKDVAEHMGMTITEFKSWNSNPKVLTDGSKVRPSLGWLKELAGAQSSVTAQTSTTKVAKEIPSDASPVVKAIVAMDLEEAEVLQMLRNTRAMRQIASNLVGKGIWKKSWRRNSYYGDYEPDDIEAGLRAAGFDVDALLRKL